jgi:hypothetical protein
VETIPLPLSVFFAPFPSGVLFGVTCFLFASETPFLFTLIKGTQSNHLRSRQGDMIKACGTKAKRSGETYRQELFHKGRNGGRLKISELLGVRKYVII